MNIHHHHKMNWATQHTVFKTLTRALEQYDGDDNCERWCCWWQMKHGQTQNNKHILDSRKFVSCDVILKCLPTGPAHTHVRSTVDTVENCDCALLKQPFNICHTRTMPVSERGRENSIPILSIISLIWVKSFSFRFGRNKFISSWKM